MTHKSGPPRHACDYGWASFTRVDHHDFAAGMAGLRLELFDARVTLARPQARALDAEGVFTLLCAVVTRSGWAWQAVWRG